MLLPTHFIITSIIATAMQLKGTELLLAFLFGVLIDFDHLASFSRLKYYFSAETKKIAWKMNAYKKTHTIIHEPVFILAVWIFSYLARNYIPIIFWSLHVFLDHVVIRCERQPFVPFPPQKITYGIIPSGTKEEWLISWVLSVPVFIYLIMFH